MCIDSTVTLQQPHLTRHSLTAEHFYRILRRTLYTVKRYIGIYNFTHPTPNGSHVILFYRPPYTQVAIVPSRYRRLNAQHTPGK